MNLNDILLSSGGILLILLTMVEITPIKINPWSWIFKWIGKQTQKETIDKVDQIQKDITAIQTDLCNLKEEDNRKEAQDCRYRILRFADECFLGQNHSMEHYKQILQDITTYDQYCADHPDFPNSVAVIAIEQIKIRFQKHVDQHDFLS